MSYLRAAERDAIEQEASGLNAGGQAAALRSSERALATLFPLPFTPFEFCFLTEMRPGFEGIISIELQAHGPLDHELLDAAYALAHARHALLSARVEYDAKGWPQWVVGQPPSIQYSDRLDERPPAELWTSTPLRVSHLQARQEGNTTEFLFAFRHVAVDGLGAFQFIADLFIAYAHLCDGAPGAPPWRRVDPERLKDRDEHQLFNRRVKPKDFYRMAKVHLPLSMRQASVVSDERKVDENTPQTSNQLTPSLPTDFLVEHLTGEETAALSRVAAKHSVMLNDLLVRDYLLMLADWNRGTKQARGPLRILIPTNMRRRQDIRMPAANVFSYAFLTRYAADCQDPARLLQSIHREMASIKREKRGLYYEAALRWFCLWPAFLRWSLNRKWAFATAVFTNLGTTFEQVPIPTRDGYKVAGDLVFESGAGAGPIRPETRISFSAHGYGGRLAICAICDSLVLTPAQQRALLRNYTDKLRATIAQEI